MQRDKKSSQFLSATCIGFLMIGTLPPSANATINLDLGSELPASSSLSRILNPDGAIDTSKISNSIFDANRNQMEYSGSRAPSCEMRFGESSGLLDERTCACSGIYSLLI